MDLHSLHRPTAPPAAQQAAPVTTYNTKQEWVHHTTDSELSRELDKARSHVAHWKGETVKMDRIAQEAMQKLHAKREAKRALKAELDAARKDADAWRARYKELAEAHTKHAAETSRRLHEQASQAKALHEQASQAKALHDQASEAKREAKALHDQASEAKREAKALHEQLAKAKLALQQLEAERPIVQERLQLGGDAFRKLQALEPRAKQLEERVQQLEADKRDKRAKAQQSHQLELDLVAAKEKVRAATQDASAKTVRVQACVDMLARAEQVLKTCSQLHASKDQASPLALALHDTTANISQFLLRVDKQ